MRIDLPQPDAEAGSVPGVRAPIVIDGVPAVAERRRPHARRAYHRDSGGPELGRRRMKTRTGGQILVDQLSVHGVDHLFCVPGESYLAVLDALYESPIAVTVCRQEGGAAMMADAYGKLTGRPGICFVTRGPGATNASHGIHIARHDSTPLILFVGQVDRTMRDREAFQEIDYRAVFGSIAKWVDRDRRPRAHPRARLARLPRRDVRASWAGGDRTAGGHAHRRRRRSPTRCPTSRSRSIPAAT